MKTCQAWIKYNKNLGGPLSRKLLLLIGGGGGGVGHGHGAVGLVGGGREVGHARALTVGKRHLAVLAHGTSVFVEVGLETLFKARKPNFYI